MVWDKIVNFFVAVGEAWKAADTLQKISYVLTAVSAVTGVKGYLQARNMQAKGQDILANKTSAGGKIPVIYGTRRVGAQVVYMSVNANDSRDLYVVYALAVGEVDEIIGKSIELDGNRLTDSARFRDGGYIGTDKIASGNYSLNTVSQNGTGIDAGAGQFGSSPTSKYRYVMNLHHGAATQTADPMLVASMPEWTSAHKLNGIAYIAAHYGYDKEGIWSGVPQLTVQVRGKKVYDPRLDDTAGGSGSQRFDDVSTYAYSDNPALCFLNYITDNEVGKGLTESQINMSTFSSAADVCDTEVDNPFFGGTSKSLTWSGVAGDSFITIGGSDPNSDWWQNKIGELIDIYDNNGDDVITGKEITDIQRDEFFDQNPLYRVYFNDTLGTNYSSQSTGSSLVKIKRFHCNGYLDTNKNVMENAKELLANMRGIFLYIDGKYELQIEDTGTSTFTITDDHIIADAGISVDYGNKDKKANKVIVEFFNANKKYELDTATVLHDATPNYYSDDNDEILEIKAEFPYVTDPYIAYNMGKAILTRSRKQMTIQFLGTPEMYKLNVGDIVTLSYAGTFDETKTCRVEALELQPNGLVAVSLIEYFDVYTWETPPEEPLEELANLPSAYAVKAPTNITFTDTDSSSTGRPFLSWDEPTDFPDYQYRVNVVDNSGNQVINRIVDVENCDLNFVPTGSYVANITSLNTLGTESSPARFPTSGTFTIGDAPTRTPDIKDDAITTPKILDDNVTDAKIQSLTADKITAGTIDASVITVTNLDADNITSGSIDASQITVTNLDADNITSGTLDADTVTVSGGDVTINSSGITINGSSSSINLGSGAFTVSSAGVISATSGEVGGFTLGATSLTNTAADSKIQIGSGSEIFTVDGDGIYLGNATFANAPFKVLSSGEVQTTKSFTAGVAGSSEIAKMSGTGDYRFWSGNETPSNASFSVDKDGKAIAKNLVLKLTDGTVYFDSATGFSSSAISQISTSTGTRVSTVSSTFDADTEYEEITVTANTTVNLSVSIDTNFGGSGSDFNANTAIDEAEQDVPENFTLTIEHSSDGGSSYSTVVTDTFSRVNDRLNPKTTPASDEYKINTTTEELFISGQGGVVYLTTTTTSLNLGCVDADGRTTLSYTGLSLSGISTGTTHRIRASVSTTDTNYDTTNNNVSSTAPRVISVTDPSGDGFYVSDSAGSQVAPEGDITRVQITTASNSGLTGGANYLSGDATFTLALASSIDGAKTFTNNVVIQGDLDVQGTTTTIDTTNLDVKDKNITLNYGSGDTSANANGAGITIQDAVSAGNDATLTWNTSDDSFNFSHNLNFTDSVKAQFGTGNDLQIYHDGLHSYIKDVGTGTLYLAGDADIGFTNAAVNEWKIKASTNGAVTLYYDNAPKLATSSTGIDVTGEVKGDSLDIDGVSDLSDHITLSRGGGQFITKNNNSHYVLLSGGNSGDSGQIILGGGTNGTYTGNFIVRTGTTSTGIALTIDSSQNATFSGTISSGAITSTGNVTLAEYLYHSGNTGTNLRFQTDRATLTSGGGASVDAHSNGNLYLTGTTVQVYGNYSSTGTISSGAITSSGLLTLNDNYAMINAGTTSNTTLEPVIWARSQVGASIVQMNVQGDEWQFGGGGTLDTTPILKLKYGTNAATFAGTISSGAITSSAAITATNFNAVNNSGYGTLEVGGSSGAFIDLKKPSTDDYDVRIVTDAGTGGRVQSNGVFDIDAAGDITLDADGGDINLKDNGTSMASFTTSSATFAGTISSGDIEPDSLSINSGGYRSEATEGTVYKYFLTGMGTVDNNWKKICDVTVATGLYKALAMRIILESQGGNFGNTVDVEKVEYLGLYYRSAASQDSVNNAELAGINPTNHQLRIIKTSTGNYELQILMVNSFRDAIVEIEVLSTNDGTVTMSTGINNGSTTGTVYSASANSNTKNIFNSIDAGTISSGAITTSGDINFGDNNKAQFGASNDLQIYHDGSHSYVQDVGTGSLILKGTDVQIRNNSDNDLAIYCSDGNEVNLYHNGSPKLATSSSGIDVTGAVTSDSLTVNGTNGTFAVSTTGNDVTMSRPSSNYIYASNASGDLHLGAGGKPNLLKIDNSGDISFYEDTGTTAKLFWDASAESLGIGTTSVGAKLEVTDSDGGATVFINNTQSWTAASLSEFNNTALVISPRASGAQLRFSGSTGDVRIQSLTSDLSTAEDISLNPFGGNVGIGTSSPTRLLHISSSENQLARFESTDSYGGIELCDNTSGTAKPLISALGNELIFYNGGSTHSEAVRISSGNVGIGTTNATVASGNGLVIYDSVVPRVHLRNSTSGDTSGDGAGIFMSGSDLGIENRESSNIIFYNNNEKMRISSSGNVGISEINPSEKLAVAPNTDVSAEIGRAHIGFVGHNDYAGFSHIDQNATGSYALLQGASGQTYLNAATGQPIYFRINNSNIARFDSSGNLLVSKTFNDNTTAGVVLRDTGEGSFVASGQRSGLFNRLSSDGEIINFRKDGATVGTIGTNTGNIYLTDGTRGVAIDGGVFYPTYSTGGAANSVQDLGSSSVKWKDLYLSGTARSNTVSINGTTVIDSSRNLTNIGTISSGDIEIGTSTGYTPVSALAINEAVNIPAIEIIPTTDVNSSNTASIRLWGTKFGTANRYSEIKNITDGSTANNELVFDTNGSEALRLDSSQNATFAGTISSGAITLSNDSSDMGFGTAKAGSSVAHTASVDEGIFWHTNNEYGIYRTSGAWSSPNYQQLKLRWLTGIEIDGNGTTYGKSGINFLNGNIKMDGTQILDASRNLTNIGTISSGRITANAGTGVNLFYSSQTSTDDWQTSPISIRERGLNTNNSTSSTYAPNLNFHWANIVSRSLTMLSDGNFVLGEWGAGTPNTTSNLSTLNTGAYQINATTVIDSSRNIINANAVGIGTASVTSGYLLHLKSTGDAAILLEADTDNVTETDNPRIQFSQDGGLVQGRIGYTNGANTFEVINEYNDALILGQNNQARLTINSTSATFAGNIIKSGGTSSQFLKADGSVQSSSASSPQGTTSPFNASANTLTFLINVAHLDGLVTGSQTGVLDLSTGELEINSQGEINIKANSIEASKIAANTITASEIASNTITGTQINADLLNVQHFDNVSADIKSHLTTETFVPLSREGQAYVQRTGTYTGSNASFIPVTITQVRNNATYVAIFSGVLGDVSGGRVQYSLNNSTWVNANGNTNISWSAGTYRGYTYVYTGQITTLSTSQSTVYWRVYFSGSYNHTQLSLNVMMDNTQ